MDVNRGDVVLVAFGRSETGGSRPTRPCVVVQNDVGNANSSTTIVAPATGTYRGYPFEVLVEADDSPFERDSSVRLDQIRVVSIEKRIHSVVGNLDAGTMTQVDDALKLSLGLN